MKIEIKGNKINLSTLFKCIKKVQENSSFT